MRLATRRETHAPIQLSDAQEIGGKVGATIGLESCPVLSMAPIRAARRPTPASNNKNLSAWGQAARNPPRFKSSVGRSSKTAPMLFMYSPAGQGSSFRRSASLSTAGQRPPETQPRRASWEAQARRDAATQIPDQNGEAMKLDATISPKLPFRRSTPSSLHMDVGQFRAL